MLLQRLDERGTQQCAVQGIAVGHLERLLPDSKRVREGRISQNTGAYAPACGRLSLEKTEQMPDDTLAGLSRRIAPELERPVMLLDGSSLSVEHRPTPLEAFPAGRNKRGLGHWGTVKWVVQHDAHTGIAMRRGGNAFEALSPFESSLPAVDLLRDFSKCCELSDRPRVSIFLVRDRLGSCGSG